MKSVFEYVNYRNFLEDYYSFKKSQNSYFSYRTFSDKIGFRSRDFIYRIIHKDKKISEKSIFKIATALDLKKSEVDYFESLVKFNQAENGKDKNRYYRRFLDIRRSQGEEYTSKNIDPDQMGFFTHWYTPTVHSIIEMEGFNGNFSDLAKKVKPNISAREARDSVETLIRLGFITKKENQYHVLNKSLVVSGEVEQLELLNYYLKGGRMALDAVESLPKEERNVSGLTLGISQKTYKVIEERLNQFREEIAQLANADEEADQVFQLNLYLHPTSEKLKKKNGGEGD